MLRNLLHNESLQRMMENSMRLGTSKQATAKTNKKRKSTELEIAREGSKLCTIDTVRRYIDLKNWPKKELVPLFCDSRVG